ncbi:large conductance mechanosensitive channel protein MscL [uncultured Metabacillus sp.]|uniref:large conductance mechanosensitive channel protein MscL n=1 Tax=uncultured Metabacillus sp. TaxID=2860135 RepID=UPI00262EC3E8|nr:large conductance mechanosensitive channel protein MscL [uncultured Metabacillus sp.]
MLQEFKKFALKGNVLDLAVAVVIGAAFGKIVTSLVEDIITPTVGLLMGGINFSHLSLTVGKAAIKYGEFIQSIVDFLIIAFSIFLVVRFFNRFKKKEENAAPAVPEVDKKEELLTEIRDLLKEEKK